MELLGSRKFYSLTHEEKLEAIHYWLILSRMHLNAHPSFQNARRRPSLSHTEAHVHADTDFPILNTLMHPTFYHPTVATVWITILLLKIYAIRKQAV